MRPFLAVASAVLLALHVLTLVVFAGMVLLVAPRFGAIFEDFEAELPSLTLLFFSVPPAAYAAAAVGLIALLIVKEMAIRDKLTTLGINVAATALTFVLAALYVIAVFLPLVKLIDSLAS